ncbi:MAG: glutamate--tRNA ligase [Sphaerospermopsis sp. SIO1G2]|nr:glutamate--tRNA ligase [Sphaerospermopsis sp. SIO1G2]
MSDTPKVRFAPSPTGFLHVGNLRIALMNWLFSRKHGGTFILRIDDTDQARSTAAYDTAIQEDLAWLGLTWDALQRQSARFDRYAEAKERLLASGRLYPCYDTPQELDIKRKMLISRGKPPIYDRSALSLTDAQKAEYKTQGRRPHYRFLLHDTPVTWDDMIRGNVSFSGQFASDPVLIREDGIVLFTLATCVDDGDMGITHILRGEDHVSNSAVQVQIFEALGYKVPHFGHMALLGMKDGKLSKREGSASLKDLREKGMMPQAIQSYLSAIGTSDPVELCMSLDMLIERFDCSKFSRSMALFEEEDLARLNAKQLHHAPYEAVSGWLHAHGMSVPEDFWLQIRANISQLADVKEWWELVAQPVTPHIDEPDYCAQAAQHLPEGAFSEQSWAEFTGKVKSATGRKGKQLFMPLRLALTARTDGPELPILFSLLGREKVYKRLHGEIA